MASGSAGKFFFLDTAFQMRVESAPTALTSIESDKDGSLNRRLHRLSGSDPSFDFADYSGKMDMVVISTDADREQLLTNSMQGFKMIRPQGMIAWINVDPVQTMNEKAFEIISWRFPLVQLTDVGLTLFLEGSESGSLSLPSPDSRISLSVIIATCNRAQSLSRTIRSVMNQTMRQQHYEVIVVDNNSLDSTREVVAGLNEEFGGRILYHLETTPGLVYARHAGARAASGAILCYIDDDAIAEPIWLEAIYSAFKTHDIAMAGGRILPRFESDPPDWVDSLWADCESGRHLGSLSLLDLGDEPGKIDPCTIWGCNLAIRKQVLFEVGGFHPDSMPRELIRYRGDGEGGLALKVKQKGYHAWYQPDAVVHHCIPASRLNMAYFIRRLFSQGISDSYSRIRRRGMPTNASINPFLLGNIKWFIAWMEEPPDFIDCLGSLQFSETLQKSYEYGYLFHLYHVLADPELLAYVRKPDYFKPYIHHMVPFNAIQPTKTSERLRPTGNPQVPDNYKLGLWLMEEKLYYCAETILKKVKADNPGIEGINFSLAFCLAEQGKAYEAEQIILSEPLTSPYRDGAEVILKRIKRDRSLRRNRIVRSSRPEDIKLDRLPLTLNMAVIYITEMCNSRCITCNSWKNQSESQLDTGVWKHILSQIRSAGITSVAFVGGEPLLRADLADLIAEAKNLNFSSILISTNGFLFNESRAKRLLSAGANSFHISLDGGRETYLRIRGRDWFERVVQTAHTLSGKGVDLLLLTILMRQNLAELEQIVAFAHGIGARWFPNILENGKYLFKGVDTKTLAISDKMEIDLLVKKLTALKAEFPQTVDIDKPEITYIRQYLENPERERHIPCTLGFDAVYIDPHGNLYPSCMSLKEVGNLIQTDLSDLVRSDTMKNRIEAMVQRRCPGCTCGYPQRAQDLYFKKTFSSNRQSGSQQIYSKLRLQQNR